MPLYEAVSGEVEKGFAVVLPETASQIEEDTFRLQGGVKVYETGNEPASLAQRFMAIGAIKFILNDFLGTPDEPPIFIVYSQALYRFLLNRKGKE